VALPPAAALVFFAGTAFPAAGALFGAVAAGFEIFVFFAATVSRMGAFALDWLATGLAWLFAATGATFAAGFFAVFVPGLTPDGTLVFGWADNFDIYTTIKMLSMNAVKASRV
jgi:hypothetical protein